MADLTTHPSRLGRIVFAAGIAAIATQNLVYRDFLAGLQPAPAWLPARSALAVLVGLLALGFAVAIVSDRGLRRGARGLAALLALSLLALHVPRIISHPSGGTWAPAFEVIALGSVAVALALPASPAGRLGFGASLLVFGLFHFVYLDYIVSVIPAWIPAHMFWALATGVAHLAAGASLVANRKVQLAATLLTIMFGSWVVLLHIPRAVAHPAADEFTSLFIAIAMCGGSWLIGSTRRDA